MNQSQIRMGNQKSIIHPTMIDIFVYGFPVNRSTVDPDNAFCVTISATIERIVPRIPDGPGSIFPDIPYFEAHRTGHKGCVEVRARNTICLQKRILS